MKQIPKYPRTFHWPWSPTVHADDKVHQNPENFVGVPVVVTEKLDGGNTCLHGGEVYARSTTAPSHAGWMAHVRRNHAWKTVAFDKNLIFYGEDLSAKHSIEYTIAMDQTYYLFATLHDIDTEKYFLSWEEVEQFSKDLMVPTAPVLFKGTFDSVEEITRFFEYHMSMPSVLDGEREGFVIRLARTFEHEKFGDYVAKYVRPDHVQTDEHWTRNWEWNNLTS